MLGGAIAIVCGVALAGLSWGAMYWEGAISPWVGSQQLLAQWVVGSMIVGGLMLVGGARAVGMALVGSSICCFLAYPAKRLYGGQNLETLVHAGVILASVGLVGFGLAGLLGRAHAPLGRYPMALVLAFGIVVVGTLLIRRINAAPVQVIDGFDDSWLQTLLGCNIAFLALLCLVQARKAARSFEEAAGPSLDYVMSIMDPDNSGTENDESTPPRLPPWRG